MKKKTYLLMLFVAMLGLLTSGCISIEQEIFLEADGSGDMVMHISLPDIPEAMMKNSPAAGAGQPDPKEMMEEMKKKFASGLPSTVQLKEAKEVKRNGAFGFYIVLHFKQLSELESALDSFSKDSLGEKEGEQKKNDKSYWKVTLEKKGDLTIITQRMFMDLTDAFGKNLLDSEKEKPFDTAVTTEPVSAPKAQPKQPAKRTTKRTGRAAAPAPKEEEPPPSTDMPPDMFKGLMEGEAMQMVFSSLFKFRFVVHAPKNFTETNADIVLNGKTAIWNASFGAFINPKDTKEKKELEMKVVY